jgi:hypothetical protein
VDASIDAEVPGTSGLIRKGRTVFQVKAGDFKPWQAANIKRELFGKGNPFSKDSLGSPIRACLDANGTYVLVCTGIDLNKTQRTAAEDLLRVNFSNCGYADPRVDVLSQNQLLALLESLPSLRLDLNDRASGRFETHRRWADHDQMRMTFKPGEPQTALMNSLAGELRKHDGPVHIHINGEAGIGKTRLVLEALRPEDLAPLVIYCDGPSKIRDSDLLNSILREDNPFSVILVVDECDIDMRSRLWDKLKHCGSRIKLVTIFSEFDETTGHITYLTAPALDNDRIIQILQEYLPAAESAQRWAEFCSGSPRVAHVVGLNLRNNPDDLLRSPDTVNVWDRYIVGPEKAASVQVLQRRAVLQRLALFKRFGFGAAVINEAKSIAALVSEDDPSITWARFEEIVHELKARKILQGENTLYITPKLLHIKLWVDWWNIHGNSFVLEDFAKAVPGRLLDWFFEMSRYAEESQAAQRVFKTLLDEGGPFQQSGLLKDPRGARFFLALTEASPREALRTLEVTVGGWTKDELLQFATGRREAVWALERIAVWRDLFPDAARLLLKLAEAENETWSNNATGVFADLFSPGRGQVAPTEAAPEERFPVLKEALEHESKECRKVALLACSHALETGHFSRIAGTEHQGLKRQPQLWMPKTWGELFDAYRRVWRLMEDHLDRMPDDERAQAVDIMLNQARGLSQMGNLTKMVTDTITELTTKPYVDKNKVIEAVEDVLHYDAKGYPPEMREPWERLQKSLVSNDFSSLMQRYVAMELLQDHFDDAGNLADKAGPKIESLAEQAVKNPELLKPELPWLVTSAAKSGYRFGYSLGTKDPSGSLLPLLLGAQRTASRDPSVFFLGGYTRALFEREKEGWEEQMDLAAADPVLRTHVPELTWRSGMTDRAAIRVLSLAREGIIPPTAFRFFSYGGVIRQMSEPRFIEWIEFLLGVNTWDAATSGLDLCHFYYLMRESEAELPRDLTLKLLTAEPFFTPAENRRGHQHEDYEWTKVAKAYVNRYPNDSAKLAGLILEHFREDGTIVGGFHSQTDQVLIEILRLNPEELWNRISGHLGPPIDSRAFHLKEWLRDGALSLIPPEHVWKWVDEKPEKRAWYVATFVPPIFPGDSKGVSAREVLVRYGSREDVRNNLMANFSTEFWYGPESSHCRAKLECLRDWKRDEENHNVLLWNDEYMRAVEYRLERVTIEEERED